MLLWAELLSLQNTLLACSPVPLYWCPMKAASPAPGSALPCTQAYTNLDKLWDEESGVTAWAAAFATVLGMTSDAKAFTCRTPTSFSQGLNSQPALLVLRPLHHPAPKIKGRPWVPSLLDLPLDPLPL